MQCEPLTDAELSDLTLGRKLVKLLGVVGAIILAQAMEANHMRPLVDGTCKWLEDNGRCFACKADAEGHESGCFVGAWEKAGLARIAAKTASAPTPTAGVAPKVSP